MEKWKKEKQASLKAQKKTSRIQYRNAEKSQKQPLYLTKNTRKQINGHAS